MRSRETTFQADMDWIPLLCFGFFYNSMDCLYLTRLKKKRGKWSIFFKFNITIQLTVFTVSSDVLKVKLWNYNLTLQYALTMLEGNILAIRKGRIFVSHNCTYMIEKQPWPFFSKSTIFKSEYLAIWHYHYCY